MLITWHEPLVEQVVSELDRQLDELSRGDLARQSLEDFGALITVADREQAARLADLLATEHLHVTCRDPEAMLESIRCAGAAFLGPCSPVPAGDYAAGPSHVLPTGATARFASGLSSNDFLRSNSVISWTEETLRANAEDIVRVAEKESLTAHAAAVRVRLEGDR